MRLCVGYVMAYDRARDVSLQEDVLDVERNMSGRTLLSRSRSVRLKLATFAQTKAPTTPRSQHIETPFGDELIFLPPMPIRSRLSKAQRLRHDTVGST